jgi:predicted RNA binding protein YcfA (HicA-like mRNA interferase family)
MGQTYTSAELIQMLKAAGWQLVRVKGDHHQFKHPERKGTVTVPHPNKTVAKGTANSILKHAGLK